MTRRGILSMTSYDPGPWLRSTLPATGKKDPSGSLHRK